eukprot:Skav228298  [mRNA]  locus=scaffold209:255842:256351:- [translate_table: standard]
MVSVSDASTTGGGLCVSRGLSPYGVVAAAGEVRGSTVEEHDFVQVLTIGLFDGIGGVRLAADMLGLPIAGHISVEKMPEARRVVEAAFPDTIHVEDIELVDSDMVKTWSLKFSSVGVVLVGSGPPCQGVSGLNSDWSLKRFTKLPFSARTTGGGALSQIFPLGTSSQPG